MEKNKDKEELLKDNIFNIYSISKNEPLRQDVYLGQLSDLIFKWCKKYLNYNVDNMGVEIIDIAKRLLKEESKANIPKDKDGFFKYLTKSLKREKAAYFRNYETGTIKIPVKKSYGYKKVEEDIIRMTEKNSGNKLNQNEELQCILKWFKNRERYIEVKNAKNIASLSFSNDDNEKEIDLLNIVSFSLTGRNISKDNHDDYQKKLKRDMILKTVKVVLEKKQDRSRECYRSLYTIQCIEKTKGKNIEWLYSVLDFDIIKAYQEKHEIPKQYEIYQKHHPEAKDNNKAGICASTLLINLNKSLKAYIKEKYPEYLL